MGTKVLFNSIVFTAILLAGGCDKRITYDDYGSTPVQTLNWTSTAVIYDPNAPKKDLSLIIFINDNDDQCRKFASETLIDTAVVRLINESFNIARVDPLSDTTLIYFLTPVTGSYLAANIYKITTLPTTCVLDSDGEYLTRWVGFINATEYADYLKYAREHY